MLVFILLNILNVILQTFRSIATVKYGKGVASIANAVAYGVYTVLLVFISADGMPIWLKAVIVACSNLLGVFVVKWIEEIRRQDKLWKVEMTVRDIYTAELDEALNRVPHNYIEVGNHTVFNCYCATQEQSTMVKELGRLYRAKFFVAESQIL